MEDGARMVKDSLRYADGVRTDWGWKLLVKAPPMSLDAWVAAHETRDYPQGFEVKVCRTGTVAFYD